MSKGATTQLTRRTIMIAPCNTKLTNTFWEKRLQVTATGRNWNTVTSLLELADE